MSGGELRLDMAGQGIRALIDAFLLFVPGAVNAEVTLDCGGVEIVAIITSDSVQRLGLVAGKRAYAVVKASDVLVAID